MDLRVVYIQDVLKLRETRALSDSELEIRGKDLASAASVWMNRQPSPSFSVISDTRLRAEIPPSQLENDIQEISVLSTNFTASDRSVITMQVGTKSQHVSGLLRLIQRFIMLLLRNPGSDILDPSSGGGLGRLVAGYIQGSMELTASDVALAVTRTERQLLRKQARNPYLLDSERLATATLLGMRYSHAQGSASARIELSSQSGDLAISELEV